MLDLMYPNIMKLTAFMAMTMFLMRTEIMKEVLYVSSTTEPIRRRIGSVVELTFNKSVVLRVRTVGPAILALFLALSVPDATLPPFALLATLAFSAKALGSITSYRFSEDSNSGWDSYPVPLVC
jgi:hypothetical protein